MVKRLQELYYITHVDNIPSILRLGILSHAQVEERKVPGKRVYDEGIVAWRKRRAVPGGLSLWEYANLYFQPRNPMLYRLVMEGKLNEIAVLGVRRDVLTLDGVLVTTGNAARIETTILPKSEWKKYKDEIVRGTDVEWWSEVNGSKRRIMAGVLVPRVIPPEMISNVYVPNNEVRQKVLSLLKAHLPEMPGRLSVIPEPHMFFQPRRVRVLTPRLKLVDGDMFFSPMQTLTISVNTVGVMGKGLASRAKYQFPDAYVVYQDAWRKGAIQPGKPFLYKREASLDVELADEPYHLTNANRRTWFLFFPTKRHWRESSRLEDIEQGLMWIVENYQREKIESLALSALGCGLGGLDWGVVGPVMVKYLSKLDIEVHIHLPLERSIPDEQLRKEFLLGLDQS